MRTTILAVLMLTITTGAAAQGERELEFGGGLHLWNLQEHYDFSDFPHWAYGRPDVGPVG